MEQFKNPLAQAEAMTKPKPAHVNLYGTRFGNVDIMFGGEPHTVVRNKGYNEEFDEDDLIIRDKAGNLKHVGSSQIYWENPFKPKQYEVYDKVGDKTPSGVFKNEKDAHNHISKQGGSGEIRVKKGE